MRFQLLAGFALLLLCGCFPGVHLDPTVTKSTPAAYTTTTVSCGGNRFTLSTGTLGCASLKSCPGCSTTFRR